MPVFKDAVGREWVVSFDGLTLGDVRDECKVDLCDPLAGGYLAIYTDDALLVKVLTVLLRESLTAAKVTARDFAKAIRGQVLESAFNAVWDAAADFFPESKSSALRSNLDRLRENQTAWNQLRPMLAVLNQPDMPGAMREAVMEYLKETMQGLSISAASENGSSATVSRDTTPSPLASATPESSASVPSG